MSGPTTVAFDADDTLWQNLQFYRLTEERFAALLADYADPHDLAQRINDMERRNLKLYGFGIKGFVLSLIETAVQVTDGRVPSATIADILAIGREMLVHPVELLPHAAETVRAMKENHRVILITKGDLFDQERKIAASGLANLFDAVEIVSNKNAGTYRRLFSRHCGGAEHAVMIGNSLNSDVIPALDAGAWGVFVPHEIDWVLDHADEPTDNPRYRRIAGLNELQAIISELS